MVVMKIAHYAMWDSNSAVFCQHFPTLWIFVDSWTNFTYNTLGLSTYPLVIKHDWNIFHHWFNLIFPAINRTNWRGCLRENPPAAQAFPRSECIGGSATLGRLADAGGASWLGGRSYSRFRRFGEWRASHGISLWITIPFTMVNWWILVKCICYISSSNFQLDIIWITWLVCFCLDMYPLRVKLELQAQRRMRTAEGAEETAPETAPWSVPGSSYDRKLLPCVDPGVKR